jgi:hypothetical protein
MLMDYMPPSISNIGFFGAMSSIYSQPTSPPSHDEAGLDPELDVALEQYLIQTYFDMAHCQYPMLLKHQFLQWAESWRVSGGTLPTSMKWKGFFVYMVSFMNHIIPHDYKLFVE